VIQARERGLSFADILRTISPTSSIDNLRKVWQRRSYYKSLAAAGTQASRENGRRSEFGSIEKRMYVWFIVLSNRGRKHIPFTISLLQEQARKLSDKIGVRNFKASRSWVQWGPQRQYLESVVLHGAGGSVNLEEAEKRMATVRGRLQDCQPENIFNMDKTEIFYRCLRNRSFFFAEQR